MNIPFEIGSTVDNTDITNVFKCAPQGGMRRSHATNSLVLVSNHIEKTYDDKQVGDVFLYTGMGMSGDQSLSFAQNKTLDESKRNDIEVYFFEVFESREYVYRGRVELARKPYISRQQGEDGASRQVWIFPLKILQNNQGEIDKKIIGDFEKREQKAARKLSIKELKAKASSAGSPGSSRLTKTTSYIRNQHIAEYTRKIANGICQLCNQPAPFKDRSGNPFLESHHIIWLSKGGPDTIENTVALCPNCHKRMHVLNEESDIVKLDIVKRYS
jgi:5-methylcytosine-specific restriction protein A